MIYTCDHCLFTFKRAGTVEACPDCGKPAVREATKKEKDKYLKYLEEQEDWAGEKSKTTANK